MGIVKRRKVILYARVSIRRKDDLVNQVKHLEENVEEHESNNRRRIWVEREEEGGTHQISLENRAIFKGQQLWDFSLGVALRSRQNLITAVRESPTTAGKGFLKLLIESEDQ